MNTKLRERLEEAAVERVNNDKMLTYEEGTGALIGFMWGAEQGYKEAIAQAKEWIEENLSDYEYNIVYIGETRWGHIAKDFEADMNKLWEGEK